MPALGRHSSTSSILSMATTVASTDTAVSDAAAEAVTRKRPSPAQLDALHTMFEDTPYPTRDKRITLAGSIGMELKTVTSWFQNRRQAAKRVAGPTKPAPPPHPEQPYTHVVRLHPRTPISLDHIAALAERRPARKRRRTSMSSPISDTASIFSGSTLTPSPSPSPDDPRVSKSAAWTGTPDHGDKQTYLWQLLDSSPGLPPSSPVAERDRFSALRPDAPSLRTLEYACARARVEKPRHIEDTEVPVCEAEEPLPPKPEPAKPARVRVAASRKRPPKVDKETKRQSQGDHDKDVEAAMVLINFMTRA